jgi:hypothetical protein
MSTTEMISNSMISAELAGRARDWWIEAATKAGIDLPGFDSTASFADRTAWAVASGLAVATIYSRYSSKQQHSTDDQVRECIAFAASHGMYVPPELISIDEAVKGYRRRRAGLDRLKTILRERQATVLLVFKVSRLFRQANMGYRLFQEEIVEEGLRAISVSQNIDTAEAKSWKIVTQLHGIMDDVFVESLSDHCRAGQKGLFLGGYTVGALPVGYRPVEVPGPRTRRGLPRTMPQVDPDAAALIQKHAEWIASGMPIVEGWRRWVAEGGPYDPRSTTNQMSDRAYRRMLSNIRYTGRWEYGRKRNTFSVKRDSLRQIRQPDSEVVVHVCEDLRILEDDLFLRLQERLNALKHGACGPKRRGAKKQHELCDLTTELFICARCGTRFYQAGGDGKKMQCKRGPLCPSLSAVRRDVATRAVCQTLGELLRRDGDLISEVVCQAQQIDARGEEDLQAQMALLRRKIQASGHRIDDLMDLAGQGSMEDRQQTKAKIQVAQAERTGFQRELARLEKVVAAVAPTITPKRVEEILTGFVDLLEEAGSGRLGEDLVYKALSIVRELVGGRIVVHVETRPGRKRSNVRGVFRPQLLRAVRAAAGQVASREDGPGEDVEVWLRKPPRLDALAERVHELMDSQGMSYRDVAKVLQAEGQSVNSGNVWYSYRRYYQMHDLPVPKRPYNNGRPRKPR